MSISHAALRSVADTTTVLKFKCASTRSALGRTQMCISFVLFPSIAQFQEPCVASAYIVKRIVHFYLIIPKPLILNLAMLIPKKILL